MSKSKYRYACINQERLRAVSVGTLENINKLEIGGFARLLICCALIELGGRILYVHSRTSNYTPGEIFPYSGESIHQESFKLMLNKIALVSENPNYKNIDFFKKYRNSLAHILIPAGLYAIGENPTKHLRKDSKGRLIIDDKQFVKDMIKTFEVILNDNDLLNRRPNFQLFVDENDPHNLKWENT